jgi:hypothetical protein
MGEAWATGGRQMVDGWSSTRPHLTVGNFEIPTVIHRQGMAECSPTYVRSMAEACSTDVPWSPSCERHFFQFATKTENRCPSHLRVVVDASPIHTRPVSERCLTPRTGGAVRTPTELSPLARCSPRRQRTIEKESAAHIKERAGRLRPFCELRAWGQQHLPMLVHL